MDQADLWPTCSCPYCALIIMPSHNQDSLIMKQTSDLIKIFFLNTDYSTLVLKPLYRRVSSFSIPLMLPANYFCFSFIKCFKTMHSNCFPQVLLGSYFCYSVPYQYIEQSKTQFVLSKLGCLSPTTVISNSTEDNFQKYSSNYNLSLEYSVKPLNHSCSTLNYCLKFHFYVAVITTTKPFNIFQIFHNTLLPREDQRYHYTRNLSPPETTIHS